MTLDSLKSHRMIGIIQPKNNNNELFQMGCIGKITSYIETPDYRLVLNLEGIYLKGGIHSWDFTGTVSTTKGSSSQALGTGTDPFFGIGFADKNFGYSFEHYIIDDGDISSVNVFYRMPF